MGQCCLVGLRAKSLCVGKMPAQDRALVFDFDFDFGRVIKSQDLVYTIWHHGILLMANI